MGIMSSWSRTNRNPKLRRLSPDIFGGSVVLFSHAAQISFPALLPISKVTKRRLYSPRSSINRLLSATVRGRSFSRSAFFTINFIFILPKTFARRLRSRGDRRDTRHLIPLPSPATFETRVARTQENIKEFICKRFFTPPLESSKNSGG